MKLNFVIGIGTLYAVCFVLSVYTLGDHLITAGLFLFSPVIMIWMVIRILKDDYREDREFDDYFYADRNLKRINLDD
jgi:hypothetical protein